MPSAMLAHSRRRKNPHNTIFLMRRVPKPFYHNGGAFARYERTQKMNENNNIVVPRMRTIKETAEIFNLPVHFVREKVSAGEVVAVRAGRRFLVNIDRFADYLNSSTVQSAQQTADSGKISPISLRQ